jgi:hypothetical protein
VAALAIGPFHTYLSDFCSANPSEVAGPLSQWERAVGSCRTALRLAPEYAEAHNHLELTLQGPHRSYRGLPMDGVGLDRNWRDKKNGDDLS